MITKGIHPSDRYVGYVVGNKAIILRVRGGDRFIYFVPVDFADTRQELADKYLALGLTVS